MNSNEVYDVKYALLSFPEGNSKVNSLKWGVYDKNPCSQGIISIDGCFFHYFCDDYARPLFTGPMTKEEAIGYIGCKLCMNVGDYSLGIGEVLMINRRRSYSLEEATKLAKEASKAQNKEL